MALHASSASHRDPGKRAFRIDWQTWRDLQTQRRTAVEVEAFVDLALVLVEQEAGEAVARRVAAAMLFDHRWGPQSHYFPPIPVNAGVDPLVAAATARLREALASSLDVPALATALHTTPRTLLRRFKADTGLTLQAYYQRQRLEAARSLLEQQATVDQALTAVGYLDRASFSRAFKALYGVPPSAFEAKRDCRDGVRPDGCDT